jgi:hypothetical protein
MDMEFPDGKAKRRCGRVEIHGGARPWQNSRESYG